MDGGVGTFVVAWAGVADVSVEIAEEAAAAFAAA